MMRSPLLLEEDIVLVEEDMGSSFGKDGLTEGFSKMGGDRGGELAH